MALGAAKDFGEGFLVTTDPSLKISMSPSVLTKAAFEAATRSAWLFENGIGARERVARRMNERLADLREQFRLQEAFPEHAERCRRMVREIETAASSLGYVVRPSKRGRPKEIGNGRPSPTAVMSKLIGERDKGLSKVLYSSLSAVTHGSASGVMQFALSIDTTADPNRALIGLTSEAVRANAMSIGWAISKASGAHQGLFGVEVNGWTAARKQFESTIVKRM